MIVPKPTDATRALQVRSGLSVAAVCRDACPSYFVW
jgi:hypothetical protein